MTIGYTELHGILTSLQLTLQMRLSNDIRINTDSQQAIDAIYYYKFK